MITARQILIKENVCSTSRQKLLYAIDLESRNFNTLPVNLQKFYNSQLNKTFIQEDYDIVNSVLRTEDGNSKWIFKFLNFFQKKIDFYFKIKKIYVTVNLIFIKEWTRLFILERHSSTNELNNQTSQSVPTNNRGLRAIRGLGAVDNAK